MYTVKIISDFNGAHNLRGYEGACENLHGHNWKVEAFVGSETLDNLGMVVDFKVVKKFLFEILDKLDHTYLNELSPFTEINPTSENIAKYIFDSLSQKIKNLKKINVWETDTSCASYER
ncbi:MAG: 6-carboxytetrahydropterin synthase QueD [Candidatus Omnitrophica bacterium]|nr:6-carboxytetrahydropterin synthase QueD [Candidatus Omnitrophota bacterium]